MVSFVGELVRDRRSLGQGNRWRSAPDELLLRAVLGTKSQAVEAWSSWATENRLANIDAGSQRLLPGVYRNLERHGVGGPHMGMLAGVYRRAWYHNQVLFDAAARLIQRLQDNGVPVLVIKGAARAALHYCDVGARPLDDVDVLVAPEHARGAIALLERRDWEPAATPVPRDLLTVRSAWPYRGPNGESVRLHWRAFERSLSDERELWDAAVELDLGRTQTRALAPTDELVLACADGIGPKRTSRASCIADAATIMRRAGTSLDWDRTARLAERHRLAPAIAQLLAYLQLEFFPEIPVGVIERLSSTDRDGRTRATHRALLGTSGSPGTGRLHWDAYHARRAAPTVGERQIGFLEFMVQRLSLGGRRELLGYAARKLGSRLLASGPHRRADAAGRQLVDTVGFVDHSALVRDQQHRGLPR
jgi:hypothetical protein